MKQQTQSKVSQHVGDLQEMVGSYLEVVVLPLLFCLQVEPGQPSQVLLAHRLIHLDSHTETIRDSHNIVVYIHVHVCTI